MTLGQGIETRTLVGGERSHHCSFLPIIGDHNVLYYSMPFAFLNFATKRGLAISV